MRINKIYENLLKEIWNNGINTSPRNMKIKELIAHKVILNPNDNIITIPDFKTNLNYAKEELKWYLSGTNKINFSPIINKIWKKYSDNGITANSAYGFYIFNKKYNQWNWIKKLLNNDKDSRQAIININQFEHKLKKTKDFPCTIYCQIFIRNNKLHWITNMRSNDIYYGFRNDIYCFTELQKKLANELNLNLGKYYHFTGSLHLYEKDFKKVKDYLKNVK